MFVGKPISALTLLLMVAAFSLNGCRSFHQADEFEHQPTKNLLATYATQPNLATRTSVNQRHHSFELGGSSTSEIATVSFQQDVQDNTNTSNQFDQNAVSDSGSFNTEDAPAKWLELESNGEIEFLTELEIAAFSANPAIAEMRAEIESLRGRLTQAGLRPNPTAGIIGEDINEDGGAGRYGVFLSQRVVRGNKLGLSRSVVCAEIAAIEQRLAIAQQQVATDVRLLYYDVLVAQETMVVADELTKISRNAVGVSQRLVQAEEVAKTALLQSELELQNALVVKQQAENRLLAARRQLAALLGDSELAFNQVPGNAREVVGLAEFEPTFDELINSSPEIAAMLAEVEKERRNLARQCVEPIPDITWQTSLAYDAVTDDLIAGFQVGMPIPKFDQNQGAICQARYQIVAAERRVDKKVLSMRQQLASAYEDYLDAKLQVNAFESEIVPTAKRTLELVTTGYREGETDFLQLLTSQRTYSRINLNYLQQLRRLWQNQVRIQGMLLNDSLN